MAAGDCHAIFVLHVKMEDRKLEVTEYEKNRLNFLYSLGKHVQILSKSFLMVTEIYWQVFLCSP